MDLTMMRELVTDREKMEGSCSTGQSPQWAVVPVEEEASQEELCSMEVDWSVGLLVGRSVGWMVGRSAGWFIGRSVGWMVGYYSVRTFAVSVYDTYLMAFVSAHE
jgi:hypothetical protein